VRVLRRFFQVNIFRLSGGYLPLWRQLCIRRSSFPSSEARNLAPRPIVHFSFQTVTLISSANRARTLPGRLVRKAIRLDLKTGGLDPPDMVPQAFLPFPQLAGLDCKFVRAFQIFDQFGPPWIPCTEVYRALREVLRSIGLVVPIVRPSFEQLFIRINQDYVEL
jgi:hypothetical protein